MIKRIVKMTFQPHAVQIFLNDVFAPTKDQIRAFPGCRHMELLRHLDQQNVLFTLSIWDSQEALDIYRQSALCQETWSKTNALFAEKAEAWSVEVLDAPE